MALSQDFHINERQRLLEAIKARLGHLTERQLKAVLALIKEL